MESNPSGLTIRRTLAETTARLRETPSTTPRLDAEIIVGAVLQRSRTDLLVHDDKPVDTTALNAIETHVERRCQGWPIAYLTGRRGFRDFDLQVGPGVLVPRPETETLVEQLGVELDLRGNVKIDNTFATSVPGVYCAGDADRGASLVVWAISEGREAARAIDQKLS